MSELNVDGAFEALSHLNDGLDNLEELLKPLLSKPLQDTQETLEPLQKARLNTLIGYIVHDLVWIHLKTRGTDPAGHAVMSELDRIKSYFFKIKNAEEKNLPHARIDKDAAARFIKHTIAQQQRRFEATESSNASQGAGMAELEASSTAKQLDDADTEDSSPENVDEDNEETISEQKGKGKRRKLDPFAGYDHITPNVESEGRKRKKKKRRKPEDNEAR